MTTPIVPSISDEQLADLEDWCAREEFKDCNTSSTTMGELRGLIARLRAAEADAKRYRWLRSRLPGSAYRIAGVIYSEGGDGVDRAIDAAMERTP